MSATKRKPRYMRPLLPSQATREAIELAKHAHAGTMARSQFQADVESAPAVVSAREIAEHSVELRLSRIPYVVGRSYEQLAEDVDAALGEVDQLLGGAQAHNPPGGYVQRCLYDRVAGIAFVVVPGRMAQLAIQHRQLYLYNTLIMVLPSRRILSGVEADRSTRQEIGMNSYEIARVELGEMQGGDFHVYWRSEDGMEERKKVNFHPVVQLQMVSRRIAITLNDGYQVWAGSSSTGLLTTKKARIHMEIPFSALLGSAQHHRVHRDDKLRAVYLPLRHPPLLFREVHGRGDTAWCASQGEVAELRYLRTVDFSNNQAFARATAMRIHLRTTDGTYAAFATALRNAHIGGPPRAPPWVCAVVRDSHHGVGNAQLAMQFAADVSFAVRYEVECLLALGAITQRDVAQCELWNRLAHLTKDDALRVLDRMHAMANEVTDYRIDTPRALDDAIYYVTEHDDPALDMFSDVPWGTQRRREPPPMESNRPSISPTTQALLRDASNRRRGVRTNFIPIRRVMVTPTRIVACRPDLDMLNRMLRQYDHLRDRFIRVTFADEDGDSISHHDSDDLFCEVHRRLAEGIHVAGEHFVFLAYSSSQLREHSCWFYNEQPDRAAVDTLHAPPTADQIRCWFGELSNILVASRYAARMGQAFSASIETLTLDEHQYVFENDLWDNDKKYRFTDGVGMMSTALANRVKDSLGLHGERPPSAFQIRFAGTKGVLSVWPNPKCDMVLRKSMCKFPSRHKNLEVVSYSKRLPFYLNRQMVSLLEGLGVNRDVFVSMQTDYLNDVTLCTRADGSDASLQLLARAGLAHDRVERQHLVRNVGPFLNASMLFRAGLNCKNSQFLYNVMCAFRRAVLADVRTRARIPVRDALVAIGVVDESATLQPREIFVQYTQPDTGLVTPLEGNVIVGRSPCLHPGDLQYVTAVNRPQLQHLVDVVVFPKCGDRPLPSMLSGGDLDGDLYSVIWDKRLVTDKATHPAMDYTPVKENKLDRPVGIDDVKRVMVRYMKSCTLGRIGNAHLVHADREDDGIFSENALTLARLHSTAVDFAKTGVPAVVPRELIPRNEEDQYPDFMGRHPRISYRSERALGHMYRACVATAQKADADPHFDPAGAYPLDRVFETFVYHDDRLDNDAHLLCESWNSQVLALMDHFGVASEAEIVSGQVERFAAQSVQPRGKRKHIEQLAVLNRYMRQLRNSFRDEFFGTQQGDTHTLNTTMIFKMCAWYKAARRIARTDARQGRIPMHSFPFVMADVLAQVVAAHLNDGSNLSGESHSPRRLQS